MPLEYRGQFHDVLSELTNEPNTRLLVDQNSESVAEMRSIVEQALNDKATRAQVDSGASGLVTPAKAQSEFNAVYDSSTLGTTFAQLTGSGLLPTNYFPSITTRGARFFGWTGTMTNRSSTPGNPTVDLASMNVSPPTGARYMIMAWAQVEAKLTGAQSPGLEITAGNSNYQISYGLGSAGWTEDWDVIDCVPTGRPYIFTGTTTLRLRTARAGNGSGTIDYSGYEPQFTALVVPVT